MRLLSTILLSTVMLFSVEIVKPEYQIDINGTAKDMVLRGDNLIVATDMGHIEIFDYKRREKLKEISIPDIKDLWGILFQLEL